MPSNKLPDLEPMELEVVRNVLERYKKKKGLSDDDAESSAVAAGDLVRRSDGSLGPRGWKPPRTISPEEPKKPAAESTYTPDPNDPRIKIIREEEARKKQLQRGRGQFVIQEPIKPRRGR